MKNYILLFTLLLVSFSGKTQLITNGTPFSWSLDLSSPASYLTYSKLDNATLLKKHFVDKLDKSFRFGEEITVNVNVITASSSIRLNDGGRLYRFGISSKNATSLNFIFSQFHLEKGSLMYIYANDNQSFTGAYSFLNNNSENTLGTDVLKTDNAIIEIYEPKANHGTSTVILSQIIHGFRDVDDFAQKAFGGAGNCNYDVNCPLGSDFQDQKNGVALTISGGLACSGSLVNNTSGNIIPYYLTARHCGTSTSTWVLRFNWERDAAHAICAQTNSTSNDGITTNTITGAELKASSNTSDFTLVKLNTAPDNLWNVYYNGWDHSDLESVTNVAVIHHPNKDIKKITKSTLSPYKSGIAFNGAANCQVWRVDTWTSGTTEQGSSGSPLFDQNKRIIGVLTGGSAGCNGSNPNTGYDLFGRFGYAWNTLSDSSLQLKCWLDPEETGAVAIDGAYQNSVSTLDLAFNNSAWLKSEICEIPTPYVVLFNAGNVLITSAKVKYSFNGSEQTVDWTGTLNQYESDTIYFSFPVLSNGNVTFQAEIINVNGGVDEQGPNNFLSGAFNYSDIDEPVFIDFVYDFSTTETIWKLVATSDPQTIIDQRSYHANGVPPILSYSKCLPVGCYQLIITDTYGDGWSNFEYGNGYLKIMNRDGLELAALDSVNANFGSELVLDFCLTPLSVNELKTTSIQIFPNPSNDKVYIHAEDHSTIESVAIVGMNGQIVQSHNYSESTNTAVLQHLLPQGIYVFHVITTQRSYTSKVVVN